MRKLIFFRIKNDFILEATNWMVKWQRFQHSMAATSSITITLIYWNMMDAELVSYKPHR